jgi:NitT/TauT family transport system substrate-binding protein
VTVAAAVISAVAIAPSGAATTKQPKPLGQAVVVKVPLSNYLLGAAATDFGYFKKNGLAVKLADTGSLTEELPAVLKGDINFGIGQVSDLLPAIHAGAPIVLIPGAGTVIAHKIHSSAQVLMASNPSIKTIKDVAGKTLGVNRVGNGIQILTQLEVKAAGGNPKSIKPVAVPFGNVLDTLRKGQVDVAVVQEPLITMAAGDPKLHIVHSVGSTVAAGLPEIVYFCAKSWAAKNPAKVKAFIAGMQMAVKKLRSNKGASMRRIVKRYTKTPPDIVDKQKNFGVFSTSITPTTIAREVHLLVKGGMVPSMPPVSSYVFQTRS